MPEERSIAQVLGVQPPASVAALPAEVLDRLARQVEAARRKQARTMAESVDVAVKGVPLPVRGIVRKTLLG